MDASRLRGRRQGCLEAFSGEEAVELDAGVQQDAAAEMLQRRETHEQDERDAGDHHQGHAAAARQHPIIDLQGVDRRHEHEQVHEQRQCSRCDEGGADLPEGARKRGGISGLHDLSDVPQHVRLLVRRGQGSAPERRCGPVQRKDVGAAVVGASGPFRRMG